ncbi:MAG: hypothetical protein ACRENX_01830 [Candidatus Dormibacteria bacterium]
MTENWTYTPGRLVLGPASPEPQLTDVPETAALRGRLLQVPKVEADAEKGQAPEADL